MATTVTSTETAEKRETGSGGGSKFPGPNGNGRKGNGWHGRRPKRKGLSPEAYKVTMWVVIAAIVMMFAALSSAYIILSSGDNRQVAMPRMFYLSTGIILLSSFFFENAKRSLKRGNDELYIKWILATLGLGLVFLSTQLLGWRELARQGVYFAGHPHRTFFYVFTGVHGVHLLGGMAGLSYLALRSRFKRRGEESTGPETAAQLTSLYWHTMDGLWIWLFALLLILK